MVISHREHWATITASTDVKCLRVCPGRSNLPLFDNLGRSYDNYRLESLVVEVKGVGPTTATVNLAWALDYRVRDTPATRAEILGKVPSLVQPAWRDGGVRASASRLMRQRLYNTNAPAISDDSDACLFTYVASANTGEAYWEVFANYSLRLLNPSPQGLN